MDKCPHIEQLTVSKDLSLLDPSKWLCSVCGTTEWVWACLSCAHVACGRLNEKHAVSHYEATKHHIAIEINEKYAYCYTCDDYIMEDNSRSDLAAIRSALTAIGTMSLEGVGREGGNLLRSFSHQQEYAFSQVDEDDRLITAQIHYRKSVLDKVFSAWVQYVQKTKKEKPPELEKETSSAMGSTNSHSAPPSMVTRSRSGLFQCKKRTLIPGVTGLRNLGNTCYINSIIQSLGHLEDFREYFCQLVFDLFSPSSTPMPSASSFSSSATNVPLSAARQLLRLNTVDYYQHLSTVPAKSHVSKSKKAGQRSSGGHSSKAGGLNGGGRGEDPGEGCRELEGVTAEEADLMKTKADALSALSLCQELHGLLRVLWSGKWAQVSPHGFLHSVWRAIPVFKGHAQHDAQEFLCELLDKLSQEIEDLPQFKGSENIVDHSFRGELVSQVTCLSCKNTSRRYEPFLDLSLEFPPLFQQTNSQSLRRMCHLTEMLYKFTEQEDLEPKSYSCEKCNSNRRRSSRQASVKTDARKQLLVSKPPEILRLHLKRFRWCGRNHREKINTHVAFDNVVDISPFCLNMPSCIPRYQLQGVVVHHGAGFRAGHYTAYTYNNDAGSWVHCNDSRVNLVSEEEVLLSQAYILFYTRDISSVCLDDMPVLTPQHSLANTNTPDHVDDTLSMTSSVPDLDDDSMQTLRRLSRGETEQFIDDDISISFHRDTSLIKRLSSIHSEADFKKATSLNLNMEDSNSNSTLSKRNTFKLSDEKNKSTSNPFQSDFKKVTASNLRHDHSTPSKTTIAKLSNQKSKSSPINFNSGIKRGTSLNLRSGHSTPSKKGIAKTSSEKSKSSLILSRSALKRTTLNNLSSSSRNCTPRTKTTVTLSSENSKSTTPRQPTSLKRAATLDLSNKDELSPFTQKMIRLNSEKAKSDPS